MGSALDHLMGDLRRLTACRTECPECGHVGMAAWCRELDFCRCRECGARFRFSENTYRPLTKGMSEEERRRFYKRNAPRRLSDWPPEERERQRRMKNERNRRYRERRHLSAKKEEK